jgi:hypothetical protein
MKGLRSALLVSGLAALVAPNADSGQLALTGGTPPLKDLDASVADPAAHGAYPIVS